MQPAETRAWLALHRTINLSDRMLSRLIIAASAPEPIFSLSADALNTLKVSPLAQQALRALVANGVESPQLEQDWQSIQQQAIQLVPINSEHYPELLKQIADPPPLLYVKGDMALLNQPQLAMVGSRRASRQGGENAFRFAREFACYGFVITSGLALGIDAESHRGALAAKGGTVAVLGTGIDVVYPASNRQLFEQVVSQGVIVSEFPLGTAPHPHQFPRRNRLISGMSLGVLVVEAALKSGSLITARCGLEQNREVFAIPGSIQNPRSRGCHDLIQRGAKLVETTADVMEELQGWLPQSVAATVTSGAAAVTSGVEETLVADIAQREQQLIDLLGHDPAPIDLLQQRSNWPMAELVALLTALELKGLVENQAGCYLRIV
ncbi:MAG: DNA-processing protein DprA [Pseudomonadales bacterium]